MNFIDILNYNTKTITSILSEKYNIDVKYQAIEKMLEKSKENKKRINELFNIDERLGYKKVTTKIDKTKMIENFLKDKEIYFLNLCQKFLENKFKNNRIVIENYKIDKSQVILYYYQAKQNKALFCFKELKTDIELILSEYDLKNLMTKEFFIDTDDVLKDYYYKILKECKEEFDLYIITNNYGIIFGSYSKHFQSCQDFDKDYHSGNWYNFLSSNVFMIVRLDKEDKLMSRCWCYIDDNNNIVLGRLYNATRLTGRHILNMLSDLNLINIEDYRMKKIELVSECDIGYPDFESRFFIAPDSVNKIELDVVKIYCLQCNNKTVFYDSVTIPSCCQSIGYCSYCNEPIYDGDDYIYTKRGNLYHSDCEGFFYCDICGQYYDGKDYNIVYNNRNYKLICCQNCFDNDDIIYCEYCEEYRLVEDFDKVEETRKGYFCERCVDRYAIKKCSDCLDMIFTFDDYIETVEGYLFHRKCEGYSICDCCACYHLEDNLKEVETLQGKTEKWCIDCINNRKEVAYK